MFPKFSTCKTRVITGFSVLAIAGAALQPLPAFAEPKIDPAKGCPVEDEHGNVSYVPVGTRIGLFFCGSDGKWHGGWAVTGRTAVDALAATPSDGSGQGRATHGRLAPSGPLPPVGP